MDVTERLVEALSPVVQDFGLDLFDVVVAGSGVQVIVDRPGGVDLDALTEANHELSRVLDRLDPFAGSYTLEVTSPGLERRLRTPAHFAGAIGEIVTIRTLPDAAPAKRFRGVLTAADETGCTIEGPEIPDGSMHFRYGAIERARTVFEWGPDHASAPGKNTRQHKRERPRP